MDLDAKDKQLVAAIELNARASFQDLGRSCGLSKETAIYRVKRLEEREIIERYTALVNFAQLGYTGYAVYARFANVHEQTQKELIAFLKQLPEVYWIALVGGKYDIIYGLLCPSVFAFNKIQYAIQNKFGPHLADCTIAIRTELQQTARNYLIDTKPSVFHAPFFGKEVAAETIDELDEDILSLLSAQARLSLTELATLLKTPASTVALRVKQLERKKIIQGYWTYIRPQKFGMQSYRLLLTLENMDEAGRAKLFSYVHQNPFALLAIETVGAWNFEITLEVHDHAHLQREISLLRDTLKSHIKHVDFLIMFEDDLVYDPFPLRKARRARLLERKL